MYSVVRVTRQSMHSEENADDVSGENFCGDEKVSEFVIHGDVPFEHAPEPVVVAERRDGITGRCFVDCIGQSRQPCTLDVGWKNHVQKGCRPSIKGDSQEGFVGDCLQQSFICHFRSQC